METRPFSRRDLRYTPLFIYTRTKWRAGRRPTQEARATFVKRCVPRKQRGAVAEARSAQRGSFSAASGSTTHPQWLRHPKPRGREGQFVTICEKLTIAGSCRRETPDFDFRISISGLRISIQSTSVPARQSVWKCGIFHPYWKTG
jgi:hypothetical protein